MQIIHRNNGVEIKNDYTELLGDWCNPLVGLLVNDYMKNLIFFIDELYKQYQSVYPLKEDLFYAFKLCEYKKLKVVILGNQPFQNPKSNGLAFGAHSKAGDLPAFTESIKDCVNETVYPHNPQWFDRTMKHWAEGGILMLNTTLTTLYGQDHEKYWRNFTREVIKTINREKENIVFIFLQPGNEHFQKYIDPKKHLILENPNLGFVDPSLDIFNETNDFLRDNGIKDIIW